MVDLHKLMAVPYGEDNIYVAPWAWRSQVGAYLESSPLLISVRVTGRYSVHYQREVSTNLATTLTIFNVSCTAEAQML